MTYHLFTYLWGNVYLSLFLSFWSDILLLSFRITLIILHYSLHYGYWSLRDVHFANIFFCFVSALLLCWWLPFAVLIYDVLFCPIFLSFSLFSCSFKIIATFIVEGLLWDTFEYLIFGCLIHSEFIFLLQLDSHMSISSFPRAVC